MAQPTSNANLGNFELVKNISSLDERIKRHPSGAIFGYVTIKPSDGRVRKAIMEILTSRWSSLQQTPIDIPKIPVFHLVQWKNSYNLKDSIPSHMLKKAQSYITIKEFTVIFRPAKGFFQPHAKMTMYIRDGRLVGDQKVKEIIGTDATEKIGYYGLDYSVHKNDIGFLSFNIEISNSALRLGTVWGSLKSEMAIETSEEAYVGTIVPTTGLLAMNQSTLSGMTTNPNVLDLGLTDENIKELSRMAKRKELRNLTDPNGNSMLEDFEGSQIGSSVSGLMSDVSGDLLENFKKAQENSRNSLINSGVKFDERNVKKGKSSVKFSLPTVSEIEEISLSDIVEGISETSGMSNNISKFDLVDSTLVETDGFEKIPQIEVSRSDDNIVSETQLTILLKNFPSFGSISANVFKLSDIPDVRSILSTLLKEEKEALVYFAKGLNPKVSIFPFSGGKVFDFELFCAINMNTKFT